MVTLQRDAMNYIRVHDPLLHSEDLVMHEQNRLFEVTYGDMKCKFKSICSVTVQLLLKPVIFAERTLSSDRITLKFGIIEISSYNLHELTVV